MSEVKRYEICVETHKDTFDAYMVNNDSGYSEEQFFYQESDYLFLSEKLKRAEKLEEKMRGYLDHGSDCGIWEYSYDGYYRSSCDISDCTCGLSELLNPNK